MKTVYLAGPINRVSLEEASRWRAEATKELTRKGFLVIDPLRVELAPEVNVVAWDKRAIRQSNAVLVYMPDNVQAVGSAMEVMFACVHDKAVYAFGAKTPSPWLTAHSSCVYPTLQEALSLLTSTESA